MPRNLSAAFDARLQGEVVSLSRLVLIVRRDGTRMGFTDADSALVFGGDIYEPTDGVDSSAIQSASGGVDNIDITGAVSSDRITEGDLGRGLYDGARITVRIVDRDLLTTAHASGGSVPEADAALILFVGYFGPVTISDGVYKVEARSLGTKLRQIIGDTTSRICRCLRAGNAQCRVPMGGTSNGGNPNRVNRTVSSAAVDGSSITFTGDTAPAGHYSWGLVRFATGPNAGVERDVKVHTKLDGSTAKVTLRGSFPYPVGAGDTAILEVGCDRTIETCRTKFANANNFHGEPFLPGNDAVAQTGRQ